MTAAGALHLLLAVTLTTPPAGLDPASCAADDLRCVGKAYEAAAWAAPASEQRAQYLYSAHRAFLRLFESRRDPDDLCRAHALIRQARRGPASALGQRLADSERETQSRLRSSGVACDRARSSQRSRPRAGAGRPEAPADESLLGSKAAEAADDADREEAEPLVDLLAPDRPASPGVAAVPALSPGPPPPLVGPPQAPSQAPSQDPSQDPGAPRGVARPWLIGGGVALGMSLALGGATGYFSRRARDARERGLEVHEEHTDYPMFEALRAENKQMIQRAVVTGVIGGLLLTTAIVLLTIGARRRSQNLALQPMLRRGAGGLRVTGSF